MEVAGAPFQRSTSDRRIFVAREEFFTSRAIEKIDESRYSPFIRSGRTGEMVVSIAIGEPPPRPAVHPHGARWTRACASASAVQRYQGGDPTRNFVE